MLHPDGEVNATTIARARQEDGAAIDATEALATTMIAAGFGLVDASFAIHVADGIALGAAATADPAIQPCHGGDDVSTVLPASADPGRAS